MKGHNKWVSVDTKELHMSRARFFFVLGIFADEVTIFGKEKALKHYSDFYEQLQDKEIWKNDRIEGKNL